MIGSDSIGLFGAEGDAFQPLCGRGDSGSVIYATVTNGIYYDDRGLAEPKHSITAAMTYGGKFVQGVENDL
jgi:hypothetical protein